MVSATLIRIFVAATPKHHLLDTDIFLPQSYAVAMFKRCWLLLTIAKQPRLCRRSDSANTDIIMTKQLRCHRSLFHTELPLIRPPQLRLCTLAPSLSLCPRTYVALDTSLSPVSGLEASHASKLTLCLASLSRQTGSSGEAPLEKPPSQCPDIFSTYGESQAVKSSSPKAYFPSSLERHRTGLAADKITWCGDVSEWTDEA